MSEYEYDSNVRRFREIYIIPVLKFSIPFPNENSNYFDYRSAFTEKWYIYRPG